MNTLEVVSSLDAAAVVAERLPIDLSDKASSLYTALAAIGIEYASVKGFSSTITVVTFHSSIELLSEACGFSRVTAWKYLKELKDLGICDYRTHKASCRGVTRNSGTVFMVRLKNFGARCKLSFQDLKHKWVDMDKAVRNKTTSYAALNIQRSLESLSLKFKVLLDYSLNPRTSINPIKSCMLNSGLETLLNVPHTRGKEIAKSIDSAAVALSQALQDSKSTDFYRKLLWALRRRSEAVGEDLFHTLYLQIQRVVNADIPEWSGLRSPGALLVSRLKKYKWYGEIMGPPSRKDNQAVTA